MSVSTASWQSRQIIFLLIADATDVLITPDLQDFTFVAPRDLNIEVGFNFDGAAGTNVTNGSLAYTLGTSPGSASVAGSGSTGVDRYGPADTGEKIADTGTLVEGTTYTLRVFAGGGVTTPIENANVFIREV